MLQSTLTNFLKTTNISNSTFILVLKKQKIIRYIFMSCIFVGFLQNVWNQGFRHLPSLCVWINLGKHVNINILIMQS